ncbi:MAG: hypothetical protein ACRD2B_16860 [Terriglobia bacterium]
MAAPTIERRIRWAGILIVAGLIIELITFIWIHPLAFIGFILVSCPLVAIGILLSLYSLVTTQSSTVDERNASASKDV